jgi:hypothetical protein
VKLIAERMQQGFKRIDKRFESVDKRFDEMNDKFRMMFAFMTLGFTILSGITVLIKFLV